MTVVTHSRFTGGAARPDAGPSTADHLKSLGIQVEQHDAYDDIDLAEPQFGETIVGDLTPEERALFAELYRVNSEMERLARHHVGLSFQRFGKSIQSSDITKPFAQAVKDGELAMTFASEDEQQTFFRTQQKGAMLHASLYWQVGERLNVHDWRVGVRSKFRVVKVAPRS